MIIYPEEHRQNTIERVRNTLNPDIKEDLDEKFKLTEGDNPGRLYIDRVQRQHFTQYI